MAQKRLFCKKITESDAFLDMPMTSQLLYFHLSMNADDDGFVGSPRKIMRMIGATNDDFKILIGKRFVIIFDSGVCVIKHWWIHNTMLKDRHHPTVYTEELKKLQVKENKAYTEMLTECQQSDNIPLTELNLTKLNLNKEKIYCQAKPDLTEPLRYLNEKAGKKFSLTAKPNINLVKARFKEGRTIDDFKRVIDKKVHDWGTDAKMMDYLRPKTLFNASNFESYLNEKGGNNAKPSYIR